MRDSPPSPDPFPFTPVRFARVRHDGWTPEQQRLFIRALAMIGTVSMAAAVAGMSRKSAYALLKRAGPDSGFARAWHDAQAVGRHTVSFTTLVRAVEGVEEPYFFGGLQHGTRRVYDNRLLIAAFRAAQRAKGRD